MSSSVAFATPVTSALRALTLAGAMVLAGCVSLRHDDTLPPDIEISAIDVDAATGRGTVIVTNHSRRRVLIRTNDLVWKQDAVIRRVPRPNLYFENGTFVMTHDSRLGAGESRDYMALPEIRTVRHEYPSVHVCWDNRSWACEQYWLVPAKQSWDALIRAAVQDED
jgi:hypothetical protein